jgi:hypothetical protein
MAIKNAATKMGYLLEFTAFIFTSVNIPLFEDLGGTRRVEYVVVGPRPSALHFSSSSQIISYFIVLESALHLLIICSSGP